MSKPVLYICYICTLFIGPILTKQQDKTVDLKSSTFDINPNNFGFVSSLQDDFSERILPSPSRVYRTQGGRIVAVFDDVLPLRTIAAMKLWMQLNSEWRFHENTTYSPGNLQTIASDFKRGVPWTSSYDTRQFANFDAHKIYNSLVKSISNGEEVYLTEATQLILRKGDSIHIHQDSTEKGDYTLMAYLNEVWFKNDYGELTFYDDDQNILAAVTPKFNRVVIWDSSIEYLTRPPSMGCLQSQYLLMLRYTSNTAKANNSYTAYQMSMKELHEARESVFSARAMTEGADEEIDVSKHVTKNFTSLEGKHLFVFDDLFPQQILETLRRFVLDYGQFYFSDHLDEGSDNVQWIAGFDIDPFVKTSMWNLIRQIAKYTSGKNTWFPYDIACNLIRSFDYTRIHCDCEPEEDEWTFLLYLNPEWDKNCQGETAYIEENSDHAEYITNVASKYGRAVIFQGNIPHSARPPSTACQWPRLSFAVKLSVNEWVARKKTFTQDFDQEEALHMDALGLLKSLKEENFEQRFKEQQKQKKKDLVDLKETLMARYTSPDPPGMWEEGNDGEEEEEEEDLTDDEMVEDFFSQYKDFPEVLIRKKYIYEGIVKAHPNASALKEHYDQFSRQYMDAQIKYKEIVADILGSK